MTLRALLDFRLQTGGVGRYGRTLLDGLSGLEPGVTATALPAGRRPGYLRCAPFTPWGRLYVRTHARRHRPDVLHGLHLELPPLAGIPSVVTVLDVIPLEHPASMPSRLRRDAYKRLVESSLRRATLCIVPSEATATAMMELGADRARLRVVPLAVDRVFRPSSEHEREQARERFAGGRRYVAASVTGRAHKNARRLQVAASTLRSRAGVPVISSGVPLPDLPWLEFTGWLSDKDLRSFYGGAEAMVVASLIEGFGLPAAEALACGVPVVCGEGIGALPYLRAGMLLVDVADPNSVAGGLGKLLDDKELRSRLGKAGRGAALTLNIEALAAATASVYREAVASFT